jgi:O-antigen/teichoic acid export membrane protein
MTAQAIGVLAAPILTRLYSPNEFGAFAIYLNGVMLLSVIACLRYEMTIVLVKQRRTAMLLVLVCALIAGFLALGLWVPIIGFEQTIHTMAGLEAESHLLLVLPVSFMLAALYKVASNWAVRNKDYSGLALSKLWQSLPQTAGQISLGLLHFGVSGLVIGEIVGRLLGFLTLAVRSRAAFDTPRFAHLRRRVGTLLSYYRHYPLYSTWSALINQAGSVAPVFFLAALYGPRTAGLFALVQRVFALPMDLVGQTALTMYTAEASHAIRTDIRQLYKMFLRAFVLLLMLAAIPASLLIWSGPPLFDMVFGHEWHDAGIYAQIVALAYGVRLAVSPISQTMQMLGRQKLVLLIETTRLLSILGIFAFGYLLKSEVEAVLFWYSVILIGFQIWMLLATWRLVKRVNT